MANTSLAHIFSSVSTSMAWIKAFLSSLGPLTLFCFCIHLIHWFFSAQNILLLSGLISPNSPLSNLFCPNRQPLFPPLQSSESWEQQPERCGEGRTKEKVVLSVVDPHNTSNISRHKKFVFLHLPFCYLPGTSGCPKVHLSIFFVCRIRVRRTLPSLPCSIATDQAVR